jgi:hypothetical protein
MKVHPHQNPGNRFLITIDDRPAKPTRVARSLDKNTQRDLSAHGSGPAVTKLEVRSTWLATLPPGHRQFVCIRDVKDGCWQSDS